MLQHSIISFKKKYSQQQLQRKANGKLKLFINLPAKRTESSLRVVPYRQGIQQKHGLDIKEHLKRTIIALVNQAETLAQTQTQVQSYRYSMLETLVKLIKYEIASNKYSTLVKMHYEFISKTLDDKYNQIFRSKLLSQENQTELSIKQEKQFTQRQLFNIIYGIEDALYEFNKNDIRHGCVNLSTVLCQGNFYKITDVSSTTFVKSYDLVRRGCRNQFLSPKLLTNLQYRSLEPYYQIQDDLFSLGMIILTLTLKVLPSHFYSWKERSCTAELRWEQVEKAMKNIERNYSSKLAIKVKELINYAESSDKSMDTNSTTVNNMYTVKLGQITNEISKLDKDIDQVMSRVNLPKNKLSHNETLKNLTKSNSIHPSNGSLNQFQLNQYPSFQLKENKLNDTLKKSHLNENIKISILQNSPQNIEGVYDTSMKQFSTQIN